MDEKGSVVEADTRDRALYYYGESAKALGYWQSKVMWMGRTRRYGKPRGFARQSAPYFLTKGKSMIGTQLGIVAWSGREASGVDEVDWPQSSGGRKDVALYSEETHAIKSGPMVCELLVERRKEEYCR